MDIKNIVMGIVGIVVAVVMIASVLIPTIDGLDQTMDPTWLALFGLVVILAIVAVVMGAVRMFSGKA